jgi:hypothetical protein
MNTARSERITTKLQAEFKVLSKSCNHLLKQQDHNGEDVLFFCQHKDNQDDCEGNCYYSVSITSY